ncbi:AfsR/SARP family transcriptional regulator [Nonomuraea africana]|uniref:DNA-binding SARP family transcriptional activator n=1 Tax=Nonomuraea africana TaxID=46171 RepID=A0ABR9KAA0_9ACTN|nr:BTAD domain-containing putative transcriptional regulator [Nonomuraea africana]MBE1558765.1 DNA-binding SARP family transcriptional activator [Nonomuraea africana]
MNEEFVGVLGPIGLVRGGVLHSPPSPVVRALLGMLAASPGPLATESLIEVVWRHNPPRDPRGALHLAVCRLRGWLRETAAGSRIVTVASGYHLDLDGGVTDLTLFRAEASRPDASLESLSDSLALWRGRPFANVPGKRFDSRLVDSLLAERDDVTRRAARAAIEQGDPELAIRLIEPLCHFESLDEAAHGVLMEALVAAGRQGTATMVYDRIRQRLAVELGIEPGTQLQQAHLACLGRSAAGGPRGGEGAKPPRPRPGGRALGRESDVAQVAGLLAGHHMVTVIGPPGVGKTRLALELFAEAADQDRDGVRYLSLGEATAEKELERLPETGTELVVIDDCDSRPDLVRGPLARLLMSRRSPTVLLAAHRPLGISGEVTWAMRPLDPEATETLFRRRAAEAVPGLSLTAKDRPHVWSLCRQADGLPAVVESLAALLRTFPLPVLAEHAVADLGSLIDGANPSAVLFGSGVHQVWRGLTSSQQLLLLRLAGLPHDFSVECAIAVCGGAPLDHRMVLNSLAALVDNCLVLPYESGSGRRYRLLTPIRAMILHHYAEQALLPEPVPAVAR